MELKGWKTTAIIFIVLFTLETLFLGFMFKTGVDTINNENKCNVNVCSNLKETVTGYYYESSTNLCYCYNEKDIIYKQLME